MNTSKFFILSLASLQILSTAAFSFASGGRSIVTEDDSLRAFRSPLSNADSIAAHYYAPILWFDADEKYYPTVPFFTAFQWQEAANTINADVGFLKNPQNVWPDGSWDALVKAYDNQMKAHKADPDSVPKPRVWVFWDKAEISVAEFQDLIERDRQFEHRDIIYINFLKTLDKKRAYLNVFRYWLYYIRDAGLQGHPQDIETVFVFAPKSSSGKAPFPAPLAIVGAGHSDIVPNNVLLPPQTERVDSLSIHILVERGGHSCAPDRNGDGRFNQGFDANWQAVKLWGTRDTQAAVGLGALGNYEAWMTFPRNDDDRCMPPRLRKDVSVKLTYLPKGLRPAFFAGKFRYDIQEKLLIATGSISEEEKKRLLELSSDKFYQEAVNELFEKSQRGVWFYTLAALADLKAAYDSISVLPTKVASVQDSSRWRAFGLRLEKIGGPPALAWLVSGDSARGRVKNWLVHQSRYDAAKNARLRLERQKHMPWLHYYYNASALACFKRHLFPSHAFLDKFFRGGFVRLVSKHEFIAGLDLFVTELPGKVIKIPGVLAFDAGFHYVTENATLQGVQKKPNQISVRVLYDTGYATILSGYFGWGVQTALKKDPFRQYNTKYFLYGGVKTEFYRRMRFVPDFIQLRAGFRIPVKGLRLLFEEDPRIELQAGFHR